MKKIHEIGNIYFDDTHFYLSIDGKKYQFDLNFCSKKLLKATREERMNFEISPSGYGIHWPLIDEDLSVHGLLGIRHSVPSKMKVS